MNVIFTSEADRTFATHVLWTEPPHLMADLQNIHVTHLHTELPHFTVDVHRTSPLNRRQPEQPKTDQAQTVTT